MRWHLFIALVAITACGTTTTLTDGGTSSPDGAADASTASDAGDAQASAADADSDAGVPPCRPAGTPPPADASASELAGIGVCCADAGDCTVDTAICVSGRCCIALHDSGRRCHANSDCCSLQCSCGDSCDPSASGGGECTAYP